MRLVQEAGLSPLVPIALLLLECTGTRAPDCTAWSKSLRKALTRTIHVGCEGGEWEGICTAWSVSCVCLRGALCLAVQAPCLWIYRLVNQT